MKPTKGLFYIPETEDQALNPFQDHGGIRPRRTRVLRRPARKFYRRKKP